MKYRLYFLLLSIIISVCCNGCFTGDNKFPETFENASKESYAYGEVDLQSGKWAFSNALIGKSPKDHKNGKAGVRIRGKGSIEMKFDIIGEIRQVTIAHALYGGDAPATWQLLYSEDGGQLWQAAGDPVITVSADLKIATFAVSTNGTVRFKIQKSGGGRLNIDDIGLDNNEATIEHTDEAASRDDNIALGNPSEAGRSDADNFLISRPQYALSYNESRGTANWVSWHLSTAWKGTIERCNCFSPDDAIPLSYFSPKTSDYISTGFDRGHLCPSDDRDGSANDNAATFLMTNIAPQAPNLNRDTWEKLESYCRKLITEGNELYIIAGAYGTGGEGSKGIANHIAGRSITVPAHFWKVVVVLPMGNNDLQRINSSTRIIAVDMPNIQTVNTYDWKHYRTTVDAIESATGYDLLSNLPVVLQEAIEAKTDGGPGI